MGTLDFFRKRTEKIWEPKEKHPENPFAPPQAIDDSGSLILMQGP